VITSRPASRALNATEELVEKPAGTKHPAFDRRPEDAPETRIDALHWVFAYGSNMATDDLTSWMASTGTPTSGLVRIEPATLPDHRLVWNYYSRRRDGGAANVEPCAGRDLPGVALLVDAAVLDAIDQKEGHPRYYSRGPSTLRVRLRRSDEVGAWVYVAVPGRRSPTPVLPRRAYVRLLIAGARQNGLPPSHIAELEATPTAD
jgi:hypothetical protein